MGVARQVRWVVLSCVVVGAAKAVATVASPVAPLVGYGLMGVLVLLARRSLPDVRVPCLPLSSRLLGAGLAVWVVTAVLLSPLSGLSASLFPVSPVRALLSVVVAPVVEELLFRGVLLPLLRCCMPASVAVAVQGVLFGLAHMSAWSWAELAAALLLAVPGVVYGAVVLRFGHLAPAMVAHAANNLAALSPP